MGEARRILAVVFDAVGTLITLRESVGATYARFGAAHGARVPASRLDEAFARVVAAAPPNVHPGTSPTAAAELERTWWRERVRETFRAADGMARFADFDACFGELWRHFAGREAWGLAPGALACLDALAARGLRLAVLSNFDQRLRPLLVSLGVASRFEAVVLPSDAGAAKPERAHFEACLARLRLPASAALYVGDDAERDVAAAQRAGLLALDVTTLAGLAALPGAVDALERELHAA